MGFLRQLKDHSSTIKPRSCRCLSYQLSIHFRNSIVNKRQTLALEKLTSENPVVIHLLTRWGIISADDLLFH